jgi:hypothetical protein
LSRLLNEGLDSQPLRDRAQVPSEVSSSFLDARETNLARLSKLHEPVCANFNPLQIAVAWRPPKLHSIMIFFKAPILHSSMICESLDDVQKLDC